MKHITFIFLSFLLFNIGLSQSKLPVDSLVVKQKARHLLSLFEKVNTSNTNIAKFGRYYDAAADITYDGFHPADYTKEEQKDFVDSLCNKLQSITVNNDQWVLGNYKALSPTIHHLDLKYRKSMYHKFSSIGLTFIKTENDFLLMGVK